jgi:hypothetical protein
MQRWGFYFTFAEGDHIGATDMSFVLQAVTNHENLTPEASHKNRNIARRLFRGVLIARCLIMRFFLEEARALFPTRDIDEFRAHWLFLQLCPMDVFRLDLFFELAQYTGRDPQLNPDGMPGSLSSIMNDIFSIVGVKSLYCVLDECQLPATQLQRRFLDSDSEPRALLYTCLSSTTGINIVKIVSGTGLSKDDVPSALQSMIAKLHMHWATVTNTGGFESKRDLDDYMRAYLPPKYYDSKIGRSLRLRVWQWLRGRYDNLSDHH